VQARRDGHPISKTKHNRGFFDFIEELNNRNGIIAYEDSERWFRNGTKPAKSGNFRKKISGPAPFKQKPAEAKPEEIAKKRRRRGGKGGTKKKRKMTDNAGD
jgi:hypothetical protein